MTCANCGASIAENMKFCAKCGAPCAPTPLSSASNDSAGSADPIHSAPPLPMGAPAVVGIDRRYFVGIVVALACFVLTAVGASWYALSQEPSVSARTDRSAVPSQIESGGCRTAASEIATAEVCGAESLHLPAGYTSYFYVGSTAGGAQMDDETWSPDLRVIAQYSGNRAISIGRAESNDARYSSRVGNYAIAGIGVRGYTVTSTFGASANGTSVAVSFAVPPGSLEIVLVGGEGDDDLPS
jgi:hypothetical protein